MKYVPATLSVLLLYSGKEIMFLIRKVSIKRVPIPVESLQLLGEVDRPEEAALCPGVAGGAVLHHLHHQGVLVTVRGDGHHMLDVAGSERLYCCIIVPMAPSSTKIRSRISCCIVFVCIVFVHHYLI